jgi:hypothetical protein
MYVYIYVCMLYVRMYICMYVSPVTVEPAPCTDCRSPVSVVFHVNSATVYIVFGRDVPRFRKELVLLS